MKYIKLVLIVISSILLCSCAGKKDNKIVDESSVKEEMENAVIVDEAETVNEERLFSKSIVRPAFDGCRISDGKMRIDLTDGTYEINCDLPGCSHDIASCRAVKLASYNDMLCGEGGMYYLTENKLCFEKDGKDRVILENDFYTLFSDEIYGEKDRTLLTKLIRRGDMLVIIGLNWVQTYNVINGEKGECIETGNSYITNAALPDGENLVITNMDEELFAVSIADGTVKKLRDGASNVCTFKNRIYYIVNENGFGCWYSSLPDGSDEEKELNDAGFLLCVNNENIKYYTKASDRKKLYVNDGGSERILLDVGYTIGTGADIDDIEYYPESDLFLVKAGVQTGNFIRYAYYIYTANMTNISLICEKEVNELIEANADSSEEPAPTKQGLVSTYFIADAAVGRVSENGVFNPLYRKALKVDEDVIDLALNLKVETSSSDGEIPADVYAFCDGMFLKLGNDATNLEDSLSVVLTENEEMIIPFYLQIPAEIKINKESLINIIVNVDPEYVPAEGYMYDISNVIITEDLRIEGSGNGFEFASEDVTVAKESDYYGLPGYGMLDIGYPCTPSEEDPEFSEITFDGDISVGRSEGLYVKADENNDTTFRYMIMFVDGKLYPAFDGKYCLRYDTHGKDVTLNYKVAEECMPQAGMHVIQIVRLVPSESITASSPGSDAGKKRLVEVTG